MIYFLVISCLFIRNKTYLSIIGSLFVSKYMLSSLWFSYDYLNSFNFFNYSLQLMYRFSSHWSSYENSITFIILLVFLSYIIMILNNEIHYFDKNKKILLNGFLIGVMLFTFIFFGIIDWKLSYQSLFGQDYKTILKDLLVLYHPLLTYICYSYIIITSIYYLFYSFSNSKNSAKLYRNIIYIYCLYTFSLLLGSLWAYLKLNWGGYWFWDPLEVISLFPWLYILLLIHTFIFKTRQYNLNRYTPLIGMFLIPCLFLFLKSNYLMSIHSFSLGSNKDNIIIVILISCFVICSILMYRYTYLYNINLYINDKINNILLYVYNKKQVKHTNIFTYFLVFSILVLCLGIAIPIVNTTIQLNKNYYISFITSIAFLLMCYYLFKSKIINLYIKNKKIIIPYIIFLFFFLHKNSTSFFAGLSLFIFSLFIFIIIFKLKKTQMTTYHLLHVLAVITLFLILLNYIYSISVDIIIYPNQLLELQCQKIAVLDINHYLSNKKFIYQINFQSFIDNKNYFITNMTDLDKNDSLLNTLVLSNIFQDILIVLIKNFFHKFYMMNIKLYIGQQLIFAFIISHIINSFFFLRKKQIFYYK